MIRTRTRTDSQLPLEQSIAQVIVEMLAVPQTLEQIQQSLIEQDGRIAQMEEAQALQGRSLQRSEGSIQKLTQGIEAFYQRQQCLDQASERFSLLSQEHYDRHVIEPLTRRVFPLLDMLTEVSSNNSEGQTADVDCELSEALAADLYELLAGYGVEPVVVTAGSVFDGKTMQPVHSVRTYRPTEDKTVQSMVRPGFRRDEQILRPAMVSIYRFEGSERILSNSQRKGR